MLFLPTPVCQSLGIHLNEPLRTAWTQSIFVTSALVHATFCFVLAGRTAPCVELFVLIDLNVVSTGGQSTVGQLVVLD